MTLDLKDNWCSFVLDGIIHPCAEKSRIIWDPQGAPAAERSRWQLCSGGLILVPVASHSGLGTTSYSHICPNHLLVKLLPLYIVVYITKTLVSIWCFVTFSWVKYCIIEQNIVNKGTSNRLSCRMLGPIIPKGMTFGEIYAPAALMCCCCCSALLSQWTTVMWSSLSVFPDSFPQFNGEAG